MRGAADGAALGLALLDIGLLLSARRTGNVWPVRVRQGKPELFASAAVQQLSVQNYSYSGYSMLSHG